MGNNQYEIASMLQITRQMGKSPELDRLQYIKNRIREYITLFLERLEKSCGIQQDSISRCYRIKISL
jgi:hypothetical protein